MSYTPTFSPRTRTRVYVLCLLASVITALVCSLLAIAGVLEVVAAAAITGAVSTACAVLAAGFGVAYRPTRAVINDDGTPGRHVA